MMPHPTLIPPTIPRGTRPWRLAGPGRSQPYPEDLHLALSPSDGTCALFVARARSTITAVYHYDNGRYGPAWVIGSGPGVIDTAALAERFAAGAPLVTALAGVLSQYDRPATSRREWCARRLAAAGKVTALLRGEPVVRSTALAARRASARAALPAGQPVHPLHLADRYLDAIAAATGVRSGAAQLPDLRVLAHFIGVTMEPEVARLRDL